MEKFRTLVDGITQPGLILATGLQLCALPVLWLGMCGCGGVCVPCFPLGHAGGQGAQCSLIGPLVWVTRGKGLRRELVGCLPVSLCSVFLRNRLCFCV